MKTDIGTYGKHNGGLDDDEIIALFEIEFGDLAALAYFEFVTWDLRTLPDDCVWEETLLVSRGKVRDFIDGKLLAMNWGAH